MDVPQDDSTSAPRLPPPLRPSANVCEQELPPHWKFARDHSGDVYYYNYKTNQTQWNPPLANSASNFVMVSSQASVVKENHPKDADMTEAPSIPILLQQQMSTGTIPSLLDSMRNVPASVVFGTSSKPMACSVADESPSPMTVNQSTHENLHIFHPITSEVSPSSVGNPKHQYQETFGSLAKWNCDNDTLMSIQAVNKPTRFRCLRCSQSFPLKQSLDEHCCNNGVDLYICEGCNRSFSLEKELQQHVVFCGLYKPEHPVSKNVYICESCSESFSVQEQYKAHILYCQINLNCLESNDSVVSSVTNCYVCESCNKSFSAEEEFEQHVLFCGLYQPNEKEVSAAKNKCFNNKNVANRKRVRTGEQFKDVLSPQHKIGHQNDMHLIPHEKGFKCLYCEKVVARKQDMIIHLQSHTGERPYACNQCNKTFTARGKLTIHVRIVHKREKPNTSLGEMFTVPDCKDDKMISTEEVCSSVTNRYACESCKKLFSVEKEFQQHVLSCGLCDPNDGEVSATKNEGLGKDVAKTEIVLLTAEQFKDVLSPQRDIAHQNETHLIPHKNGFKCPYCEKVVAQKMGMIIHIRSHTGERPYKCSQCNKNYAERGKLNRHVRVIHNGGKPNLSLGERFVVVSACNDNEIIHTEEKFHAKLSPMIKTVADHKQSPTAQLFKCTRCEKAFGSKKDLYSHEEIHNIQEKLYQCSCCRKCFSTKCKLELHKLRHHTGEKLFQCAHCDRAFETMQLRNSHEQSHPDKNAFNCSHCDKTFNVKKYLDNHLSRCHIGEKRFLCSTCGKSFLTKSELELHTRVHTGEKPFICSYCEKAFISSGYRLSHVRQIHTGEKPFECTECPKVFTRSEQLKKHKRVHTGEKPYACSHCGKKFAQSNACKAHEFTHTGERPFVCACGRSFIQRGLLNYHQRKCILKQGETK